MPHLRLALLPLLFTAVGCGDTRAPLDTDAPDAAVRDSAGVAIVENARLAELVPLPWTLGEPLRVIGGLEGDEASQLYRVRDALLLDDGRLAVADGGSQEIRVFDASGAHLRSLGGAGEGPGEFNGLAQLATWPGDSLLAWDARARRLSYYDRDGRLGRTVALEPREGLSSFGRVHVHPDGEVIVTGTEFGGGDLSTGLYRPDVLAIRIDDRGGTAASLGSHPGTEGFLRIGDGSVEVIGLPLPRSTVATLWGDRFVAAGTENYSLPAYTLDGELERIVRVGGELRPVTEADVARQIDDAVARVPEQFREGMRSSMEEAPYPDFFPRLESAASDALGNLWVEDFRPGGATGPRQWTVFDPEGVALGRVETPAELTVFRIEEDRVVGLATDDLDVERVVVLPLDRGAGG